jgi:uncharacterized protein with PIN domain
MTITVDEKSSATPLCPHCDGPLGKLLAQKTKSTFGVRYVYFCDRCRKVLGISHRKGFFMG